MQLEVVPGSFAICRLPPEAEVPAWTQGHLVSVTRTPDELSILCDEASVPTEVRCVRGRRALRVAGTLDMSITGVLAALTGPLAKASVPVFVISSFDTDYVFVPPECWSSTLEVLTTAGHVIVAESA